MSTTPLFDQRPPFDRARLAGTLRRLAAAGVRIGTSSWRYEGWLGQVYSRERYMVRGRFSAKRFEAECLGEYGETFPAVCGDFSFYQFPSEPFWKRLFLSAPPSLEVALKVPEQITAKVFPRLPRYGAQSGLANSSFLDKTLFEEAFLAPLAPWQDRVAALIFEFGSATGATYSTVREFVRDLDRFLAAVPRQVRYSVEVRNPELLAPEYFHCLRAHNVAHAFNSWTRMPPLPEQIRLADAVTADFLLCRALLAPGRAYQQAVELFSPYEEIRQPYPEGRQALRDLIDEARALRQAAFLFVNNRFEGNAPQTIEAIAD
jgi:uncharacterized protein YecE (DUF72 family)